MDGIGWDGQANGPTVGDGGRTIAGFSDLARIGSGGSSTVYRATDLRHQRPVAIKVLDLEASNAPRRTAFQREIEAIGRVGSHPYIVTVLGSGFTDDDRPYLVMPLFERGTFGRLIDENGPLTWSAAIDVGIKLCSAVETVHRAGVVHRDVKPGNVFVGVTPEHPLLADFGISSTIDGERTETRTMAVTFGYTAPEVLDDERPTPASDIYSLAMTIFRFIQGLHAYHADSPAAIMRKILSEPDRPKLSAGVPPAVAAVVADGLARDPSARPASALEMARRLQHVQVDNGLPATPVVVADEPAVDTHGPVEPVARETSTEHEVEDAMVAAVRRLQRQRPAADMRAAAESVDLLASRPVAPRRSERADVERLLADAIITSAAEPRREPRPAVDPSGSPAVQAPATPLDEPTVVTPRRSRHDVDHEPDVDTVDNRWRWRVGLAILVAVLTIVAFTVVNRTGGGEMAPSDDGSFVGGSSP